MQDDCSIWRSVSHLEVNIHLLKRWVCWEKLMQRDSQPNVRWSLGNPVEEGEGLKKPEQSRTPKQKQTNKKKKQKKTTKSNLIWAFRCSSRLNCQLEGMNGTYLGHQHICNSCAAESSCEIPNKRSRDYTWLCCLSSDPFPLTAECLNRKRFAYYHCNLIWQGRLIYMGGLPLSEDKGGWGEGWEKRMEGKLWLQYKVNKK